MDRGLAIRGVDLSPVAIGLSGRLRRVRVRALSAYSISIICRTTRPMPIWPMVSRRRSRRASVTCRACRWRAVTRFGARSMPPRGT